MAVVDVVLTTGQSQMVGHGDGATAPVTDPDLSWEWDGYTAGVISQLRDGWPFSRVTATHYDPQTGSCLPAFANVYTSVTGRPLLVVRAAYDGTALIHGNGLLGDPDWSPSSTLVDDACDRYADAIAALTTAGHTVGNQFIIWSQGFRDAIGGDDLETYSDAQTALLGRFRTGLGIPGIKLYIEEMYVPHASSVTPAIAANCEQVVSEQHESVDEVGGDILFAFTGGDTYDEQGLCNSDHLHYNQAGLNIYGPTWARFILIDQGYDPDVIIVEPPTSPEVGAGSVLGRRLRMSPPLPPLPRDVVNATISWTVPLWFSGDLVFECEGGGGNGGQGGLGVKSGAGGGGAYAKTTVTDVVPGESFTLQGAGQGGTSQVTRDSTSTVICKAVGGANGANGPNTDGAGGAAASCIGDVTTSGQAGGVSGIDNGGNGAAPLGGAGGVWVNSGTPNTPGTAPGGGGAASIAGSSNFGGAGASGLCRVSAA